MNEAINLTAYAIVAFLLVLVLIAAWENRR